LQRSNAAIFGEACRGAAHFVQHTALQAPSKPPSVLLTLWRETGGSLCLLDPILGRRYCRDTDALDERGAYFIRRGFRFLTCSPFLSHRWAYLRLASVRALTQVSSLTASLAAPAHSPSLQASTRPPTLPSLWTRTSAPRLPPPAAALAAGCRAAAFWAKVLCRQRRRRWQLLQPQVIAAGHAVLAAQSACLCATGALAVQSVSGCGPNSLVCAHEQRAPSTPLLEAIRSTSPRPDTCLPCTHASLPLQASR